MSNVNYSFVQNSEGSLTFQSKVNSFGLDHVTEKDLVSFYRNFSKSAYFDSGLLPVDGSGMLSIRTAGAHTQIGYQHKPGMYYINWGGYEGDPNASKIYVAQPYRIVIADLYNGNILGARTFYSPIPVCHPDTPLYHVNLPNINCKGYRGNGVGWICLYHTEDISSYPFNEKIAKILDRCSGTEAYNDANMSETDGPRFYQQNHKPSYIWDPKEWENYSEANGVDWTLNPDLWIPVLVTDIDHQGQHVEEGIPLTYAGAVLGDYQAYYTDPIRPKPVNIIARNSNFDSGIVFDWFKLAYNSSNVHGVNVNDVDSFLASSLIRENLSKTSPVFQPSLDEDENEEEEDNENYFHCDYCESVYSEDDAGSYQVNSMILCEECYQNHVVYVEHLGYSMMESECQFNELSEQYYHLFSWTQKLSCDNCATDYVYHTEGGAPSYTLPLYTLTETGERLCKNCLPSKSSCAKCESSILSPELNDNPHIINVFIYENDQLSIGHSSVCNACWHLDTKHYEKDLSLINDTEVSCMCGNCEEIKDFKPVYVSQIGMTTLFCESIQPTNIGWQEIYQWHAMHGDDDLNVISNRKEYQDFKKDKVQIVHPYAVTSSFVCHFCRDEISAIASWTTMYKEWLPSMIVNSTCKKVLNDQNDTKLFGTSFKVLFN
jgi:hypothetical protein